MELPNYFFADLGAEEALSEQLVWDAALTLKRNGQTYLRQRSTASIIRTLAQIGELWCDPEYEFRKLVLEKGPKETGFSKEIIELGLNTFFEQLTQENLEALVSQEMGHMKRLDAMSISKEERFSERAAMAVGPDLLVHITAGNLPASALSSIVLGFLIRSPQFVKCAKGTSFIPRMFAHSIYFEDSKLGSSLEVAEWQGGNTTFEKPLFQEARLVTAMGSDETLKAIHDRLPQHVRFIGYGHRTSFAFVARESLEGFLAKETLQNTAHDICAWDQSGCLSPQVIYVERDGLVNPSEFASRLAKEMDAFQQGHPRGAITTEEAALISSTRAMYEMRSADAPEATQIWASESSTNWTVVYEADPIWQSNPTSRFVYVKAVDSIDEMLRNLEPQRYNLSTVGVAAPEERLEDFVTTFAQWGITRICPIGRMQKPPITWRHDGRPPLAEWVTWVDWEQ
ncbi:hypothetical protein N9B94_00170 [Verrucomicrobia bacterium]|nr:hypothetical protein [Verrucomicrobiota bacterium]